MNAKKSSKTKIISDNKASQNIASISIVKSHCSYANAVLNKNIVPVNDKFLNSSPSNDINDLKKKYEAGYVSDIQYDAIIDGQSSSKLC